MLIYNYDKNTKEYTFSQVAEKDPEETRRQGQFVPLVPAYATLLEPLSNKTGYAICFNGEWQYVEDHRGQKVINPLIEEDYEVVDYLGQLKDGYIDYEEYINSEEYKKKKEQEEHEKLMNSSMTKLDFFKYALVPNGIDYDKLQQILHTNDTLNATWQLCERVYRGDVVLEIAVKEYLPKLDLDKLFKEHGA